MPRAAQGGAYEIRGRFFARVTIAAGQRKAIALPWATTLAQAEERARALQGLVTSLHKAKQQDFVAKVVEIGATDDAARWADLVASVGRIVAGKVVIPPKAPPKLAAIHLATATETWLTSVDALYDATTLRTLRQYASRWPAFFGDDLTAIDSAAIARFMADRLGKVTRSTAKKELWGLRAFLTWANEVARTLPALPAFPRLPKRAVGVRVGRQREKAVELSTADVEALLGALPERARPRYIFAAETGLRPATIDALRVPEHYTRGATTLHITAEIDKARYARDLPLTARARAILDAIVVEGFAGAVFGTTRYLEAFKAAVRACGLPTSTAPYDLRHARGTHGVEASGGNLTGVAFMLGHRQVTTTNRYVHASRRAAAEVVAALDTSECSRIDGCHNGCKESDGDPARGGRAPAFLNDSDVVRRTGVEPVQELPHWNLNPQEQRENAAETSQVSDPPLTPATQLAPSAPVQPPPQPSPADPIEAALAVALEGATKAGQWSVVATLAGELAARRATREGAANVVPIGAAKKKRGR